jgi:hypothetical protein
LFVARTEARRWIVGYAVELRTRAVMRSFVVEFSRAIALPFAPVPWLFLHEGALGVAAVRLCEVTWDGDAGKFICLTDDDVDAAGSFGDDLEGVTAYYESRGWQLFNSGPITRVLGVEAPARELSDERA